MLQTYMTGDAMKMATVRLSPGQVVFAEAGKFLFSSADVGMETKLSQPSDEAEQAAGGGGFGGFLKGAVDAGKRMVAGESLAFCHFSTQMDGGVVSFAGVMPGDMRVLELDGATTWFVQKDAFIAAEAGVHFDIAFSGLKKGFKGGEGFILEKFTGQGTLILAGVGNFIDINLADYGGKLKVDTGCAVAWDHNVTFDVERVGQLNKQGIMNAVLGGEGFSLATLTGNGRVILQSMTLTALRESLNRSGSGESRGDTSGGGAVGGLFGR